MREQGKQLNSPANVTAAARTESCMHSEGDRPESAGSSCSRLPAVTLVDTGKKTEVRRNPNGGEMFQANGGEMFQCAEARTSTLSAAGEPAVSDGRACGRVETVLGYEGERASTVLSPWTTLMA